MSVDTQAIAAEYAEGMVAIELESIRKYNPARMATITDDTIEHAKSRFRLQASDLIDDILLRREPFLKSFKAGRFDPCNKCSRRLFERLTGITLPAGVRATDEVIRKYCGHELEVYELKITAQEKAAADREAAEEAAATAAKVSELRKQFASGKPIDSEDFILLAKEVGFDLHPRTIGAIRDRFHTLGRNGVTFVRTRKGNKIPDGIVCAVHGVYNLLQ